MQSRVLRWVRGAAGLSLLAVGMSAAGALGIGLSSGGVAAAAGAPVSGTFVCTVGLPAHITLHGSVRDNNTAPATLPIHKTYTMAPQVTFEVTATLQTLAKENTIDSLTIQGTTLTLALNGFTSNQTVVATQTGSYHLVIATPPASATVPIKFDPVTVKMEAAVGSTATVTPGDMKTKIIVTIKCHPGNYASPVPFGTIVSIKSAHVPPPTVTAVLPNSGPLAGGLTVKIEGTAFTTVTTVSFGTTHSTSVVFLSTSEIMAKQPAGAAGTVNVRVSNPFGTSPVTAADQFTYTNAPIITGVTPSSGPTTGGTKVTITGLQMTTATKVTFGTAAATSVHVTSATQLTAVSPPHAAGTVNITITSPKGTSVVGQLGQFTYVSPGYWEVASDGGIFAFGTAAFYGSMGGKPLNKPIVGMAATPTGGGYWMVASDGGIFAFGNAQFYGSMGGKPLNQPIVGMAATPTGGGYWLVASDGGIFAFGNAQFYGSMGGKPLNKPIVGMAAAPTGGGYWMVASDGGIFAFGATALFYGSEGGKPLNKPMVGMAATVTGLGYWTVASDGGMFSFGSAVFYGSMGGKPLNEPMVGMAATVTGGGYWTVASDGGIFAFGSATFHGSMGGKPLNKPIVGMAAS
jgi:hypothetical protein